MSRRTAARASRATITALLLLLAIPLQAQIAVRGGVVHPVSGPPIADGVVLIEGGKIRRVAPAAEVTIPEGTRLIEAAVVTPGLIDAHTSVGLTGILNQAQDQDQLERSEPIQPELRAIDAYDAREELVAWVRSHGITTIHTGHAPGALISGQTMIAKTRGSTVDEAVLTPFAMVAATLGDGALVEGDKTPGTRSKAVALLRAELIKAQEYRRAQAAVDSALPPPRDLRLEALGKVLALEVPLLVTAHRVHDIAGALRLQEEFGFRLVLDGAAEAPLLLERIAAAKVPVLVHPPMARPTGQMKNASMALALRLDEAAIPFAFQSGYESYVPKTRVVLFEAAVAAGRGLPFTRTLEALTRDAARILGIADRVGTLEPGKDADLALFDGDPFEYTTHVTAVIIDGKIVSDTPR
jgi:imidazolonepropionase-like amidohydrolase